MNSPRPSAAAAAKAQKSTLRTVLASQYPAVMQAGRLSFVLAVLSLVPSWYMFEVYGRVLSSRNHETLAWLVVAALGLYAVMEMLEVARSRILARASSAVSRTLTPQVFDAIFVAKMRKLPGGNSQALSDVRTVADGLMSPVVTALMDLPGAVLCLTLLFVMNIWIGVAATLVAVLLVAISLYQERRTSTPLAEASQAQVSATVRATGTLANAKVIESMGMEGAMFSRWMRNQQDHLLLQSTASDHAGTANALTKLIQSTQSSLLMGLAAWAALSNTLTGGASMLIVASILGGRALQPMAQLVAQWRVIGNIRASYRRLAVLLAAIDVPAPGMPLPPPKGLLTIENALVTPPGGKTPVLKGISFGVRPGELLVVLGPSAAGKSTLARVLVGVWPAQAGFVRLDGADMHMWHKSQLGLHIGYMPQGVELFDGTVAENIARFGKVDMESVRAATDDVGLTAFIESLPDGFETAIGDDGATLSGGQRQRIALARAIYGNPRVLVLDEPNASLDDAGERELVAVVQRLKARGATVVAITHRGSLVGLADRLLVLVDGTVAKYGPRDEVLAAMQQANHQARARGGPAARPGLPAPGQPLQAVAGGRTA